MIMTRRGRPAGGAPERREERTMILVVQHTVKDYDAWKPVFDEHESVRARHGATGHTIYRDVDDPNAVTIFNTFETREGAEVFSRDPSLKEAMERGGVTSEPRIMWVEEADSARYAASKAA
jgi:quinol monooxygenase YgiN